MKDASVNAHAAVKTQQRNATTGVRVRHPQRVRKKTGKELHVESTLGSYPNAVGTFSPSPAESSIWKECAANHPHFERRPGHLPATHRSSRQLSPPLFPASAPPSLST